MLMKMNEHVRILTICFMIITVFTAAGCGGSNSEIGPGSSDSEIGPDSSDSEISPGSSSITLAWDPPTENTDGSSLTNLAGYKIYYGTSSNNYTKSIDVGNATTVTIDNLSPGLWCFAVIAYNISGNESDYSTELCEYV
jgi:hypothetical protein